jgi:MFS family permease
VIVGILVGLLSVAGPISRFLQGVTDTQPVVDLSGVVSLLAVVVVLAFSAGVAYAFVAIPAQTQLQEELPEDVRGRVFGVLNMLVSVASFLPIIVVGFIVDLFGTTLVIAGVGLVILTLGIGSILARGPLRAEEALQHADTSEHPPGAVDLAAVVAGSERHVALAEGRPGGPAVALDANGVPRPLPDMGEPGTEASGTEGLAGDGEPAAVASDIGDDVPVEDTESRGDSDAPGL